MKLVTLTRTGILLHAECEVTMKITMYRDHDAIFQEIKESGRIGIPFFILDTGEKTFDISEYIDLPDETEDTEIPAFSCSIDSKGQC